MDVRRFDLGNHRAAKRVSNACRPSIRNAGLRREIRPFAEVFTTDKAFGAVHLPLRDRFATGGRGLASWPRLSSLVGVREIVWANAGAMRNPAARATMRRQT